jgi:hypothetical protein
MGYTKVGLTKPSRLTRVTEKKTQTIMNVFECSDWNINCLNRILQLKVAGTHNRIVFQPSLNSKRK